MCAYDMKAVSAGSGNAAYTAQNIEAEKAEAFLKTLRKNAQVQDAEKRHRIR